jgi:ferredoxin
MLRIRKDLCAGCGLCADNCPRQAISFFAGQAEIDNARCNECGHCVELCPRGAIVEAAPVSVHELKESVASMTCEVDNLIERIERLRQRS